MVLKIYFNTERLTNMKKSLIALFLVVCCFFGVCPTAFAATTADTAPYGFTYDDASSGCTWYKLYTYDRRQDAHVPSKSFYSIGSTVYNNNGTVLASNSAGSGSRYNGFATNGDFFYVTSAGALISVGSDGKQSTWYASGVTCLLYNSDDLATSVQTTSGNQSLTGSTVPSTPTQPSQPSQPSVPQRPGNNTSRVEMYTNAESEFVRNAYEFGNLKVSIIVSKDEKSVLNATHGVRLSDTLKGAKFLGFDTSYNVYLYESNGTLYRFTFGNWYSAEKVTLDSKFKTFRTDSNGFLSEIVTEKSTYTLKQFTSTNDKWIAKETYAVVKDTYATLYTKGTVESNTLMLTDGSLYLNGTIIASRIYTGWYMSNITAFGFISDKQFCYIRDNQVFVSSIYDRPQDGYRFCYDAASFNTNKLGLVTQVVLTNGKTLNIT